MYKQDTGVKPKHRDLSLDGLQIFTSSRLNFFMQVIHVKTS